MQAWNLFQPQQGVNNGSTALHGGGYTARHGADS
jgi:hypothetical protein